jgi:hypothetical protein
MLAVPLTRVTGLPTGEPSTLNWTDPGGGPSDELTLAVNVTVVPDSATAGETTSVVVVGAGFTRSVPLALLALNPFWAG